MRLSRCENGHLFDLDRDAVCPFCAPQDHNEESVPDCGETAPAPAGPAAGADGISFRPEGLSDFQVLDRLGEGSTGCVYRVCFSREYAMKMIPWENGGREKARREYAVGRSFADCPGILRYLDCYEQDQQSCLLLELSEPLLTYYRRRQPTVREVLHAALDVCGALSAIRGRGYLHCDVKPGNIFCSGGTVRLGDFSHCIPCREGERHTRVIGTYAFAAPEVINGGACSGREDIYSFGITLYMLLSGGRHPFDLRRRDPPVRMPEDRVRTLFIHPALTAIIAKAAAYAPEDRYADIGAAADAIRAFMGEYGDMLEEKIPFDFARQADTVTRPAADRADWNTQPVTGAGNRTDFCTSVILDPRGGDVSAATSSGLPNAAMAGWDDMADTTLPRESTREEPEYRSIPFVQPGSNRPYAAPDCPEAAPAMDEVRFSVVAEKSVLRSDARNIEIAMYREEERDRVLAEIREEFDGETLVKSSHPVDVGRGARITVMLCADGIRMDESQLTYSWKGRYLRFSFQYFVPEDYPRRQIPFKANVYIDGVPATTLRFTVNVEMEKEEVPCVRSDVRSVFLSYSSNDTEAVTYLLQGIRKARPDLDVFFDVETLRSGDQWEARLYSEILKRDRLYLCWSRSAAKSVWVEREWKCMLRGKGLDAIEPFPLENASKCPAPPPLDRLHFNDIELMIREARRFERMQPE